MLCILLIKRLKVFKHIIQFVQKFSNKALVSKTDYIPSIPFFNVVQKIKKKNKTQNSTSISCTVKASYCLRVKYSNSCL